MYHQHTGLRCNPQNRIRTTMLICQISTAHYAAVVLTVVVTGESVGFWVAERVRFPSMGVNSFHILIAAWTRRGTLTVFSELDAGWKRQLRPFCQRVLGPEGAEDRERHGTKTWGEELPQVGGSDLLSCCSPRIMGFTMPLSISSFPELCRESQETPSVLLAGMCGRSFSLL